MPKAEGCIALPCPQPTAAQMLPGGGRHHQQLARGLSPWGQKGPSGDKKACTPSLSGRRLPRPSQELAPAAAPVPVRSTPPPRSRPGAISQPLSLHHPLPRGCREGTFPCECFFCQDPKPLKLRESNSHPLLLPREEYFFAGFA